MLRKFGLFLMAACLVAGCKPPPDPNDPKDVGVVDAEVLMRNLRWASDVVNERVAKGEITDEKGKQILSKYADEMTASVDISKVIPQNAWQYGDVFRLARRWDVAEKLLREAVEHAEKTKNEDRRVNDTLRLAHVEASEGHIDEAFANVRKTFTVAPEGKAPILYAVLYEIVPASEGQGKDFELAKLLEEAIAQHEQVMVNPRSDAGVAFLAAKGHHLTRAWRKVIELYRSSGHDDLADKAIQKGSTQVSNQHKL